jgi:hypothetical protein
MYAMDIPDAPVSEAAKAAVAAGGHAGYGDRAVAEQL